jgi:hypothetical protein
MSHHVGRSVSFMSGTSLIAQIGVMKEGRWLSYRGEQVGLLARASGLLQRLLGGLVYFGSVLQ